MKARRSSADTVMMVRPRHFRFNEATAASNVFQHLPAGSTPEEIQANALREFEGLCDALRREGVEVIVFDDTDEPQTPDAIFPNNWISTQDDGTIILYPMEGANRRLERREEIIRHLRAAYGFDRVVDLTSFEAEGRFLEGTGSMVFDRTHSTIYACLSSRTDEKALLEFAAQLGWGRVVHFRAIVRTDDGSGFDGVHPIYHTNVMMALGEAAAVICLESIQNDREREEVLNVLLESGRRIVEITTAQMHQFAGNMLQLSNKDGQLLWVMSSSAFNCLTPHQRSLLSADSRLIHSPLDMIELVGGGSARCMLAEVFTRPE